MKINKYLKSLRVDYFGNAEKNLRLQDIVTLIDSPAFLKEIANIREKRKIVTPVLQGNELLQTANAPDKKTYVVTGKSKSGNYFTEEPFIDRPLNNREISYLLSKYASWRRVFEYWSKKFPKQSDGLEIETRKLLIRLKRPYYLIDVALQAILFNISTDTNDIFWIIKNDVSLPEYSLAIVVNPRTTVEEVKQALRKAKKTFKTTYPEMYVKKLPDVYPNILHYQAWYWMRLDGRPYSQILKDWENAQVLDEDEELPPYTYTDVIKGVKSYKNLLSC